MYKATAKDIKTLQKWGEQDEVVLKMMKEGAQPSIFQTGYYWPSNANWAWQIGITQVNGKTYELLTRFGSVEGGRQITIPEYKK